MDTTREEFMSMTLPELRKFIKVNDVNIRGRSTMKKYELVDRLSQYFTKECGKIVDKKRIYASNMADNNTWTSDGEKGMEVGIIQIPDDYIFELIMRKLDSIASKFIKPIKMSEDVNMIANNMTEDKKEMTKNIINSIDNIKKSDKFKLVESISNLKDDKLEAEALVKKTKSNINNNIKTIRKAFYNRLGGEKIIKALYDELVSAQGSNMTTEDKPIMVSKKGAKVNRDNLKDSVEIIPGKDSKIIGKRTVIYPFTPANWRNINKFNKVLNIIN